jgi:hypothetical protein
MRSTASCTERASCNDGPDHRTDGSRRSGIIWLAGSTNRLLGAIIAHRKAADSTKEMAPALLALLLTLAYLTIALTG